MSLTSDFLSSNENSCSDFKMSDGSDYENNISKQMTTVFSSKCMSKKPSAFLKQIPHFSQLDPTSHLTKAYSPFPFLCDQLPFGGSEVYETTTKTKLKNLQLGKTGLLSKKRRDGSNKRYRSKEYDGSLASTVSLSSSSSSSSMNLDDEIVFPTNWITKTRSYFKSNNKQNKQNNSLFQEPIFKSNLNEKKKKLSTSGAGAEVSLLTKPKEKLIKKSTLTSTGHKQLIGELESHKKVNKAHLEEYASFFGGIQPFQPLSNLASSHKVNEAKKISLDPNSKFHKTLLKKNPHILINICISNGNIEEQQYTEKNTSIMSSDYNRPQPNETTVFYENHDLFIPKKKSSLLKTSSSMANKKKIKFIYGQEANNFHSFSSRSNLQKKQQHSNHHVKFNDVIELYDPEFNNKTLHSLSEFSSHLHQNKSASKQPTNDLNNKITKNFPLVKFCYEEPAVKQHANIQPNLDMKPTRVTKTKLDNFDSDFIYYFEDILNPLNVNQSPHEEEDLIDLADTTNGPDLANSVQTSKLAKSVKNNEIYDDVTLSLNASQTNGSSPIFTSIINKQLQPAMKTRGIVRVKSNNLLQSFRVNQSNQLVQTEISELKTNNISCNTSKQDEIELKIKLDSDNLKAVNIEPSPKPESPLQLLQQPQQLVQPEKVEASPETSNSTERNLEKNYFDSLSRRNLINMRRSSKSGEPCNEHELNSIFRQIYNRNRTIIAAASALSNTQPTHVLRRFSSVNNSPKTINSTSM